jgi:hypothetical protein
VAKVTEVLLVCLANGEVTGFAVDHAERILAMRDSGWALPEDSEYELNEDGTIGRRDKKKGK